jgi:anthranilate synthase component 1
VENILLSVKEFDELVAQGYNKIPMIKQAFADLETPLTLYLKLTQSSFSKDEPLGKNSF